MLNLKNPLAIFDLETTGVSISNDRIVELSFIKVFPNGKIEEKYELINPGIKISDDNSKIHGITNEKVKDKPTFKKIAKKLADFLEGTDLAGFNIIKFDVPMLIEEFLRSNVEFDVRKRKLIDAQKIFHLMEKRNLKAAYKFYCNKNLVDAHSAAADTLATYEVLKAQVDKYNGEEVTDMMGNKIGHIENDMDTLHQLTAEKMVDLAGRFIFNENGEEIINFGKHRNKTVRDVLKKEPQFYDWMMKGDFPLDTKRRLTEIKLRDFNKS